MVFNDIMVYIKLELPLEIVLEYLSCLRSSAKLTILFDTHRLEPEHPLYSFVLFVCFHLVISYTRDAGIGQE